MSLLKHIIVIVAYLALLIIMVKQSKKTVQKVAEAIDTTTEGINVEVEQTTGEIKGHVGNVADSADAPTDVEGQEAPAMSSTDVEPQEEAPPASSTDVNIPSFNKPKVQRKVKPVDEQFKTMMRNATEEERKQYVSGLMDNISEMTNKVEWVKQEFAMEVKKEKKTTVNYEEFTLKCEHSVNNVIKTFSTSKTIASIRDEFALHFGFKPKDLRVLTLAYDGKNICESVMNEMLSVLDQTTRGEFQKERLLIGFHSVETVFITFDNTSFSLSSLFFTSFDTSASSFFMQLCIAFVPPR